jgi:hypothetical protein
MAMTPATGASPYCTAAQATAYHDWRQWADLLKTDDTRYASEAATQGDARLTQWLKAASGKLEMACFEGGAYAAADLQALASNAGNGAEVLAELVADLGYWIGSKARYPGIDPKDVPGALGALATLDALYAGRRIWPFLESIDAGLVDEIELAPAGSAAEQLRPSIQAGRLFGSRPSER